jgi:hypothetical protein
MRERFAGDASPPRLPDSARFYAWIEEQELLIGEAEVCSGSAAMIMQAYDTMTGRHEVAPEALPPRCTGLEIAWEQFDAFTHHAANIWGELVLYVLRAAQFDPELTDPQLPPAVRDRLNGHLKRRGAQLAAGQAGLVVGLARGAQEFCGRPAAWRPEPLVTSPDPRPGSLAATVVTWLGEVAGDDMQTYAPVVASALESQLAAYDLYEATVLAELNRHVSGVMQALGLGRPSAALTASALSHVCGRTLRDWGDASC